MKSKHLRSRKLKCANVIRLCSMLGAAYLGVACGNSAQDREQPQNKQREGLVITEIVGEEWGDLDGAVSFLGDLDADGYDDFALLGARGSQSDHKLTGSLYLFYGRETFPEHLNVADADLVLRGAHESIAALGDVDRDGYPDFAFTTTCDFHDECLVTEGVRLVYGASERYAGELAAEEVGSLWSLDVPETRYNRVSSAGDVNADGHADLLFDVSIPEPDQEDETRRTGFLLLGREDHSEQMPTGIDFDARFDDTGDGKLPGIVGLWSPGDLDADGHTDLLMATRQLGGSNGLHQALWLYYGSEELEHTRFDPLVADASFVWLGTENDVGSDRLGDLDGDGYDELAFAIWGEDSKVLHVVGGRGDRLAGLQDVGAVSWSFTTPSGRVNQLRSGDIDADGRLDLVVGDWEDSAFSYHSGALLSFLAPGDGSSGSRDLSREDVLLYGVQQRSSGSNDSLGKQVASGGDANADGYDDILVTAPGDRLRDQDGGRAFLVFGSELD